MRLDDVLTEDLIKQRNEMALQQEFKYYTFVKGFNEGLLAAYKSEIFRDIVSLLESSSDPKAIEIVKRLK